VRGRGAIVVLAAAAVTATMALGPTVASAAAPHRPTLAVSTVPVPKVEGPITGPGRPSILSTSIDLAKFGYQEDEYFISGTARSYRLKGAAPADGRWTVTRQATARYKTRLLVYRPSDPAKFNGTVVVEWLNVSAGGDDAPDWVGDHTQLIRQGFAWVGVSAQALGVNGGTSVLQIGGSGLIKVNPKRYGTLNHPGDAYSFDIFSQAAQAIRHPRGAAPLGALKPKALIADGESQSAFFLTTYIDAVAPLAHVFNGYLVHSRWSGGASLSGSLAFGVHEPFRTDLGLPVLAFETETDLMNGYASNRQPDSAWFRDWEVAGTSHADDYAYFVGPSDDVGQGRRSSHRHRVHGGGQFGAPALGPRHCRLRAQPVGPNRHPPATRPPTGDDLRVPPRGQARRVGQRPGRDPDTRARRPRGRLVGGGAPRPVGDVQPVRIDGPVLLGHPHLALSHARRLRVEVRSGDHEGGEGRLHSSG
jgi:hypothetical protein